MNPGKSMAGTLPRILAVDDDQGVLDGLRDILGGEYQVETVRDEFSALQLARTGKPDLILLDITLGKESGVSLCYSLRSDQITRDVPIVMLTGWGDSSIRELAFTAGANGYVEKPVLPEELRAIVRSKLSGWRASA
ncbi:MAG: response regulator [Bdellovibrionota bacterium]